jgi:tetratricopeptide (TPR) repeat protein
MRNLWIALTLSLALSLPSGATTVEAGQQHFADKAYDQALTAYNAVLKKQPTSLPALLGRARVYYTQGAADEFVFTRLELYEQAERDLNTALKHHRDQADALLLRGQVYQELANAKGEAGAGAVDYWEYVSREVDPLTHKAQADFQRLIALHKHEGPAHYFLAELLSESLSETELKAYLTKACGFKYQPACAKLKAPQ